MHTSYLIKRFSYSKETFLALILLLAAFTLIKAVTLNVQSFCSGNLNVSLLIKFFRSQFIEEAGLLRASVTASPDNVTIYIANDNLLASEALKAIGCYDLAKIINSTLNTKYGGGWNGKVDVLLGRKISGRFYSSAFIIYGEVYSHKYESLMTIKKEVFNFSEPINDFQEYADLVVYESLNDLIGGNVSDAEKLFKRLVDMWDGNGFKDRAFKGVYQVYKCALFIYLYRSLKIVNPDLVEEYANIYDRCLHIIRLAQDNVTGGVHTDYMAKGSKIIILGDVNVETTSMAVLALCSHYPEDIGWKALKLIHSQKASPFTSSTTTANTTISTPPNRKTKGSVHTLAIVLIVTVILMFLMYRRRSR